MERTSFYPYPSRPGTGSETIDFDLNKESQSVLSEEQLREVINFEHQLYNVSLDPIQFPSAEKYRQTKEAIGTSIEPLELIWKRKVNHTSFGVSYFLTPDGRNALLMSIGLDIEGLSPEVSIQKLSDLDLRNVDSKVLDKLQADSVGYEEEQLTKTFIDSNYDGTVLPPPNLVTIYKNPEVILQKARGYSQIKAYISRALTDLQEAQPDENPEELNAKIVLAKLYQKRLNDFIVDTYVLAYKLLSQYRTSGSSNHNDLIIQLEQMLPAFFDTDDNLKVANTLQRFDRYRNGVSVDDRGKFTWLSPEAKLLAANSAQVPQKSGLVDRGAYSDLDPNKLATTEINGDTFGDWAAAVLQEYGLLSIFEEWDSEREGPAPDGKWQKVVNDKFKSLGVDDKQRIYKIPRKTSTVTSAVARNNHEIAHILQNNNKRAIGDLAILEQIGIDDALEQAEAGGKWQEKLAEEALRGEIISDVAGTSYLKAMLVKAQGGTFGECVQAYFEDLCKRKPEVPTADIAAQAVNRTRRIFRSGGLEYAQNVGILTNTQPLHYLEQQLIYSELPENLRRILLIGGVTIKNFIRLSKVGLVNFDNIYIPEKMPWEVLYPKVKELIMLS